MRTIKEKIIQVAVILSFFTAGFFIFSCSDSTIARNQWAGAIKADYG